MALVDGDPQYRCYWKVTIFNGAGEDFEWQLIPDSGYVPLGESGYTLEQLEVLNREFKKSDYAKLRKPYTMESYRDDYAAFMQEAVKAEGHIKSLVA